MFLGSDEALGGSDYETTYKKSASASGAPKEKTDAVATHKAVVLPPNENHLGLDYQHDTNVTKYDGADVQLGLDTSKTKKRSAESGGVAFTEEKTAGTKTQGDC